MNDSLNSNDAVVIERIFNAPIELFGFQVLPALYDTVYPMILIHMSIGLAITTLLLRNFMSALPSSLRSRLRSTP